MTSIYKIRSDINKKITFMILSVTIWIFVVVFYNSVSIAFFATYNTILVGLLQIRNKKSSIPEDAGTKISRILADDSRCRGVVSIEAAFLMFFAAIIHYPETFLFIANASKFFQVFYLKISNSTGLMCSDYTRW